MFREIPISAIAACFGMAAFTVAILSGLGAGQPADAILWRAILSILVCYPLGLIIACVGRAAVNDHMRAYHDEHPTPDLNAPLSPIEGAASSSA